jgi:hypothetical protein
MNNNIVQIFRRRDFGELISTPITFFIQEFKLIMKVLLIFVIPFIALELILIFFFDIGTNQSAISDVFSTQNTNQNLGSTLIIRLVGVFQNVMLYTVIAVYIKQYNLKGKGNFTISDIWQEIKKLFWPVFGGQFVAGLIIIVGTVFLILPGIYLAVVLSLVFAILVFEEDSIGSALSRSFDIMKGKWWTAFGAYIVMGLIVFLTVFIFATVIGFVFAFASGNEFISIFSIVLISLLTVSLLALFVLLPVILYASFITEKENPELMNRINDITKSNISSMDIENTGTNSENVEFDENSEEQLSVKPDNKPFE